jgi:hypothetical protein
MPLFTSGDHVIMQSRIRVTSGDHVIMQSRIRADLVCVTAVDAGRVSVAGTSAQFDAATGYQISHPNCWPGWRILPTE